jgi:hypothetical protein
MLYIILLENSNHSQFSKQQELLGINEMIYIIKKEIDASQVHGVGGLE